MELRISSDARRIVTESGGKLYIYPGPACCGGTRYVQTSTEEPRQRGGSHVVAEGGIELWVRPVNGKLPDVLEIVVRGRRRPKLAAYWNGCAFIV